MTEETIKRFIKEAHENAVEKGFYPEGDGYCPTCNNYERCNLEYKEESGCCDDYNCDKNIGELLMLIVSELGEALEAHRCGRFADWNAFLKDHSELDDVKNESYKDFFQVKAFERHVKDTFEDEIADVFIRLFDMCAYLNYDLYETDEIWLIKSDNIGELLLCVTRFISDDNKICAFNALIKLCDKLNIPIEKHIIAKMAYNRTREHKHGKKY